MAESDSTSGIDLERIGEPVHFAVRHRAHLAEALREDQVRRQFAERFGVDPDDGTAVTPKATDHAIDLAARGIRVDGSPGDPRQVSDRRRPVALVGDPGERTLGA